MNVNICEFGKEDLSVLDKEKILSLVRGRLEDFMPQMVKYIYANPEHPEHHNIFFDSATQNTIVYGLISETEMSWLPKEYAEVSDSMITRIKKHIHPMGGPYYNTVMKDNDTETANKIIHIGTELKISEEEHTKIKQSLSIITKDPNFKKLVKYRE